MLLGLGGHAANELVWLVLYLALSAFLGALAIPVWFACLAADFGFTWLRLLGPRLSMRLDTLLLYEPAAPTFQEFTCTGHDGVRLAYSVSLPRGAPSDATDGDSSATDINEDSSVDGEVKKGAAKRKCVLLCLPLGQAGPTVFAPLLATLGDEYCFVTWDYRGFFKSGIPNRKRRISISAHAEDAEAVLRAAGFSSASLCVGHSLGVQVALELTLLYPERVERLVLLNGCHGQAFQTAFQPVVRLPLVGTATFEYVRFLQRHPSFVHAFRPVLAPLIQYVFSPVFCSLFGSPMLRKVLGPNYLYEFWSSYMAGLDPARGTRNLEHFLLTFQEINSHSAFHLLDAIDQPTIVLSGLLDPLLPALVSGECVILDEYLTTVNSIPFLFLTIWRTISVF